MRPRPPVAASPHAVSPPGGAPAGRSVAADSAAAKTLLLEEGALPKVAARQKAKPTRQAAVLPEQLPARMVGAAHLSVYELTQLAKRCGTDRKCWRDELRRREGQEQLPA